MPPAGRASEGGIQLGRYRLLSQLAVGGMAEIYVAKTAGVGGFEKRVALKVIHPNYSDDPEFVQMLVDEAKLAVQLQHANIVQTFDLGCVANQYYIAMELIEGVDLYKLLRVASEEEIDFPFEVAAFIARETAGGLDYAHRKRDSQGRPLQIVHRDVSPQNILCSHDGEVKIVDFGIAKAALRKRQTAAGVIKGKYYYMSPEQAWGDPIDARTDVFSTGILLYEMIVGQMLYLEEDLETLLLKVRQADIAPPSMLRANVPEELEEIVMTALKKRAGDRYQSAHQLAQALSEWLHKTTPDFNRGRLGAFMHEVLGAASAPETPLDEQTARDPRVPTAHTREMLERDENSLLFKLGDLKLQRPRTAHHATSPASPPEENRRAARGASGDDFETSDRTVVDGGGSLSPYVEPPAPSAPFDGDDDATLAGEPRGASAQPLRPTLGVGPPRTSGAQVRPPDPDPDVPYVDEKTAPYQSAQGLKTRPQKAGSPALTPPDSSLTLERQRFASPLRPALITVDERPTPPHDADVLPPQLDDGFGPPAVSPRVDGDSAEIPGIDLAPKILPLRTMGVVLGIAAAALAVVVAVLASGIGSGSSNPIKAAIEVVSSPPGAQVSLDGVALGRVTPLRITDVDARSAHHVRLSLEGHDAWESDVRFAGAPTVRLQAVLVERLSVLWLSSIPPGAEAIVNGRVRGITPVTIRDLPTGPEPGPGPDPGKENILSIELRLRGYKAARTTRSFQGDTQGDRRLEVEIQLEKAH